MCFAGVVWSFFHIASFVKIMQLPIIINNIISIAAFVVSLYFPKEFALCTIITGMKLSVIVYQNMSATFVISILFYFFFKFSSAVPFCSHYKINVPVPSSGYVRKIRNYFSGWEILNGNYR